MEFKILSIDHISPYFEQVIKLGEANSATLGFFPRGAFEQHASKKMIIVAVDNSNTVIGYLLYGISRTKMLAYIVHLCVDKNHRCNGIAKALFNELIVLTKTYRAIRVHCREDYDANNLWPKLGFTPFYEKAGRSKEGSTLRVWLFEHDHPSLLTYAKEQDQVQKINVAIDANVFFQLQQPAIAGHEESTTLLEPWLDVNLYVTKEIYNEIDRNQDPIKRKAVRKFANSFEIAKSSDSQFQTDYQALLSLFPKPSTPSDESDIRQLARVISSDISIFVTRDEFLLTQNNSVYERFGIRIIRPSDLIIQQDEILHEAEYSPKKLSGSQIRTERVHSNQSSELVSNFLANQDETKKKFNHKLQLHLSNPDKFEVCVIKDFDEIFGLIAYGRQNNQELNISIIRLKRKSLSPIIARYLVNNAVLISAKENRFITKFTDEYLSDNIITALENSGFQKTSNGWIKINLSGVMAVSDLHQVLSDNCWPEYTREFIEKIQCGLKEKRANLLLEIEKLLWPLKIRDIDIPAYIIPIRPEWAMHLFDNDIAEQDLFGSKPTLILNAENVYYRKSNPQIPVSPARILWYVSNGKGLYSGLMQIKACSYVDEALIEKPKVLFAKYKNLGVYEWANVFDIAESNLDKELMAFKFSRTEIFPSPIVRSSLKEMWETQGKNFNVQGPLQITKEQFLEIYTKGMA